MAAASPRVNLYPIPKDAPQRNDGELVRRLKARASILESDASEWRSEYRDIAEWCLPFRSRMPEERTRKRPKRRSARAINDTPRQALTTGANGMMEYVSSPSRPWFKSGLRGYNVTEDYEAAAWLESMDRAVADTYARGNLYAALPTSYQELFAFGIGAMSMPEDEQDVVRFYAHTVGSYYVALDERRAPTTLVVQTAVTVEQLVQRYGIGNVSDSVADQHRRHQLDENVQIEHWVFKNPAYVPGAVDPQRRRFMCVTYEVGSVEKALEVSGHYEQPHAVVRWETLENDAYGSGPGMHMLGDAKAVQVYERHKAKLIAKLARPNYVAPSSLKNDPDGVRTGEGAVVFADGATRDAMRVLHEVQPQALAAVSAEIEKHEQRIRRAAFEDLFLLLGSLQQSGRTKFEIEQRVEEKLVVLGPVVQRVYGEFLQVVHKRTVGCLMRRGMIASPPEHIADLDLQVEFTGIMAQAMRAIGIGAVDRFVASIGQVAALKPQALDKFDETQAIDVYRGILGVSATMVVPDEIVEAKRAALAQQQQQQQMLQAAQAGGSIARDVAAATAGPSALQEAMRLVGLS